MSLDRYLTCFASVLARVAHADLEIVAAETAEMERRVAALGTMSREEAAEVVQRAIDEARRIGPAERRKVTHEFVEISSAEQRTDLIFCLYAVAAADGVISKTETDEISHIADELGVARRKVDHVGGRDQFAALRE